MTYVPEANNCTVIGNNYKRSIMFIGRTKEIELLQSIIDREKSSVAVLYGRRRVGKSELIKKSLGNKPVLYFEGLENRSKQEQIDGFIFQLCYQTGKEIGSLKAKTWREAFIYLYNEVNEKKAHIVLDEFQWMANYRSEIVSDLKMIWELYISRLGGISLILCGSIASFMINRVIKSSALYGRTDLVIHLKGFLLPETNMMLKNQGSLETIEAQMMLGGIPKYLELIQDKTSVYTGIEDLAFTETGYLADEYNRIFTSHFGRNPEYEKIIRVLAKHPYGVFRQQISREAEIELGGGLTIHLKNLESAGFISSSTPFQKGENSRLLKYQLSDAYLRFYFAFIEKNLKKIKSGVQINIFSQITQKGEFKAWMGRAFEYLCIDHAAKISEILGFHGIEFTFGPYFRAPGKEEEGVQIDLVYDRKDNVITLCEMKYSLHPIGTSIIQKVERKVGILKRTFKKKTIQKVLISQSRMTKDLAASGYFYRVIDPRDFL